MKITLVVLVAFLVCVSFAAAGTAQTETPGDFAYTVNAEGNAVIAQYLGTETSVAVPAALDGFTVAEIGLEAFFNCWQLESISLPDNLTSIGGGAFVGCASISSISLPDSLQFIGANAFIDCASLTSISLPAGLLFIGDGAFGFCYALTSIDASPNHPLFAAIDGVLFRREDQTLLAYPAGKPETEYSVPQNIQAIGGMVFAGCESLTSISLPDGLASIGEGAFAGCSALTSINLPNGLQSIGGHAFADCTSLTSISLPAGILSIGDYAFIGCPALTLMVVKDSYAHAYAQEMELAYQLQ